MNYLSIKKKIAKKKKKTRERQDFSFCWFNSFQIDYYYYYLLVYFFFRLLLLLLLYL